jgi:hypothetical protein
VASWASLGGSWGTLAEKMRNETVTSNLLGRSLGALGRSLGALGKSLGVLGRSLGALGGSPGSFLLPLEASLGNFLWPLGCLLGFSWWFLGSLGGKNVKGEGKKQTCYRARYGFERLFE